MAKGSRSYIPFLKIQGLNDVQVELVNPEKICYTSTVDKELPTEDRSFLSDVEERTKIAKDDMLTEIEALRSNVTVAETRQEELKRQRDARLCADGYWDVTGQNRSRAEMEGENEINRILTHYASFHQSTLALTYAPSDTHDLPLYVEL